MALRASHTRLHDWHDGKGAVHSISLAEHQKHMAAKAGAGGGGAPAPAAPAAPVPPPPPAPAAVAPFFTASDLQAINDFNTRYATELSNLDFELGNLQTDTSYQKTQTNKQAKENTNETAEQMAARGLFKSSIKDAALYDIEASRSLSNKFLDDKLTAATLNAGTSKKILGESKKRFDEAMAAHQIENAASTNKELQSGWAEAMAAWTQAHPPPEPAAAAPAKPLSPDAPQATGGHAQPTTGGSGGSGPLQQSHTRLYDWGDGKGPVHTIPLSQHQANMAKKGR